MHVARSATSRLVRNDLRKDFNANTFANHFVEKDSIGNVMALPPPNAVTVMISNGIINKAMIAMGLIEKPMKLLYTDFSIIIGSVYLFLPLMIVTVAGVMENIDDDMMEAAQSLGASRTEAFMKVIFPMSLPGIIVGGILVFTGTLTAYTTPQLLGGNSNMVMATLIYQRAMSVSDWTGASVIALIMIVVTLVVIKGFNALAARLDRRGEDYA